MLEVSGLACAMARSKRCATSRSRFQTGGLVAILGANGAGKSTLLRAISGIARAEFGRDYAAGRGDHAASKPEEIVRRGVSHVPEGTGHLSRSDGHRKPDDRRLCAAIGDVCARLPPRAGDVSADCASRAPVRLHAVGRRTADAGDRPRADGGAERADSPTNSALALRRSSSIRSSPSLARCARPGSRVLVVEQNARLAMKFADYLYVLKYGRVVMEGRARRVRTFDRAGRRLSWCLIDARLSVETPHDRTSARRQGGADRSTGPG